MTNKTKIAELREIGEKTSQGRWWMDSHGESLACFDDKGGVTVILKPQHLREKAHRDENTGCLSYWPNDSDASWIALAQPKTILPLIDQLEAAEARIADLDERLALIREQRDAELATNVSLEAALAALRGEVVPVGEVMHLRDGRDGPREPEIACLAGSWSEYPDGTMLFTQPAPVVVLDDVTILAWGARHDLRSDASNVSTLRCMIEDAASLGLLKSADGEGEV